MSCQAPLLAALGLLVFAGGGITMGRWGAEYVRKVNAETGGWRIAFARLQPLVGGLVFGIACAILSVAMLTQWASTCASSIELNGATILLAGICFLLFGVAITRAARGRRKVDSRFPLDDPPRRSA